MVYCVPDCASCPFHVLVMDSPAGKLNWSFQLVSGADPVLVIVYVATKPLLQCEVTVYVAVAPPDVAGAVPAVLAAPAGFTMFSTSCEMARRGDAPTVSAISYKPALALNACT